MITPGMIFKKVRIDYAHVKYGYIREPTIVNAYICVFILLMVKAVHLEIVLDFTSEAIIVCLRRFVHVARCDKP